jgi:PKD repeat protein
MNHSKYKAYMAVLGLLTIITTAEALPFVSNYADLCLGFRKTGANPGSYEEVVDIGPAINYVGLPIGTTTNINQYVASQLSPDSYANLTNLSWAVCGYVQTAGSPAGYPPYTLWTTLPRPSLGVPSTDVPYRNDLIPQRETTQQIQSIFDGASFISSEISAGQDNTATFVQEPFAVAQGRNYSVWMEDPDNTTVGDLGANGPQDVNGNLVNLEKTTGTPFTTAVQSDLYELRPNLYLDPHTGATNGPGYQVGYFQLNTSGSMTFTRSSSTPPPVAGFTGTPSTGSAPLKVVFTDASTGIITNWVWNFGDGHSITNTSNVNVTNTYATSGNYTVSLTVTGPGGSNTDTQVHYISVSTGTPPKINSAILASGKFILSGTGGTATAQYRILSSTNIALSITNWIPVYTNIFSSSGGFGYTNSSPTNGASFFRLVTP